MLAVTRWGVAFPSPSGTSGQEGVRGEMKTDFTINLPHLKRSRYPKALSLGVHDGDSRLGRGWVETVGSLGVVI